MPNPPDAGASVRYKAFISYSHSADSKLAPALRAGLRRIGQPWYRRARFRIFLDNSSLSANPGLWDAIEAALGEAEYLILLASTKSAQSEWVTREVDWWLTHRGSTKLLILVTDGEVSWHPAGTDFDWDQTTALNLRLRQQFSEEPLWVDLRWARAEPKFSLRYPPFRNAILQIAPPLYGKSREDLDDDDTRHYRAARRMAIAGLFLLLVLAAGAAYSLRVAGNQRRIAECRQLAGQAVSLLDTRLDLALLLGVEDSQRSSCVEASSAVLTALQHRPHLAAFLSGHTDTVTDVAYAPDGRVLASSAWDGTVRLWDMQTHTALLPVLKGRYGLAFSTDGKLLASAEGSSVNIWSMPGGARVSQVSVDRGNELSRVAFSAGGILAASSEATGISSSKIFLWDVATCKPLGSPIEGHVFALSPDGKSLATEGEDGKSVALFDIRTRQARNPLLQGHTAAIRSIAFSPDGQTIAAGGVDNAVMVWDLSESGLKGRELIGHRAPVNALAFNKDGGTLASASGDGSMILWDLQSSQRIGSALVAGEKPVFAVAFSPDGRALVSNNEERVAVWNSEDGLPLEQELQKPDGAKEGLTYSPDAQVFATIDTYGQVTLSEAASGRTRMDSIGERATAVAFSSDSKLFATVSWKGNLSFWDASTGEMKGAPQQTDFRLFSIAFSPDGRMVAVGGDGALLLWNLNDRRWIKQQVGVQQDRIWSLAFSPDGKLLASGGNKSFALWDANTGASVLAPVITDSMPRYLVHTDVAFSPDGTLLAYRKGEMEAALWDVARQRPSGGSFSGHRATLSAVRFSKDGKRLVTGAEDGTMLLWDIATGKPIGKPLTGMGDELHGLALQPKSGSLLALGDKRLLLWDLQESSWREMACRVANRNLTREEWNRYLGPGVAYHQTCATQGSAASR